MANLGQRRIYLKDTGEKIDLRKTREPSSLETRAETRQLQRVSSKNCLILYPVFVLLHSWIKFKRKLLISSAWINITAPKLGEDRVF